MDDDEPGSTGAAAIQAVAMLRAVIDGRTYESVAADFGITRTAVERRVKVVATRLCREVGIEGMNDGATAFVRRLRERREAILHALERFEPAAAHVLKEDRVVSADEIARAVLRIRGRSAQPARDVALFYTLFVTGARPLEIVRLRVGDYVQADGEVRRESELPAHASISGKARPLYFASRKLDDALDAYLAERVVLGHGVTNASAYRGLDPVSPLFLSAMGEGFRITQYGAEGRRRFLCRPILETYRKLFRYAELEWATPLSIRRTVVARLYDRGADEEQVGLVLGISERSAVREQFPRVRPSMASLVHELV
ncbi:MAG: site-specific integrase [Pseudomonadota bacterium]